MVLSGGFSADLVGRACVANSVQVVPNTYALAKTVSVALVREGFDSWYYIAVDNLGGQSMQGDSSSAVIAAGGKVLGSVRFPINTQDMSSYILQAKALKPKVLGLAMGGNDTVTAMKAASEFGMLADGVRMATYSFDVTDINSVGSATAQGTHVASSFYWDKNDKTRAFAKRFFERYGKMPTQYQASMYVGLTHYLKSVQAAGTDDAQVMIPKMKELKVADFNSESWVRADGSFQRELMLLRAKTPAESKYPWDYFHVVRMVPAADAYKPLAESECPLVRKAS